MQTYILTVYIAIAITKVVMCIDANETIESTYACDQNPEAQGTFLYVFLHQVTLAA